MRRTALLASLPLLSPALLCALLTGCGSGTSSTATTPIPTPVPVPTSTEPNSCKATNTTSPALPAPTSNVAGAAFAGHVMAGNLAVIGASVQVYAAGTAGNGSTPTALLSVPLITDANGAFSVAAAFTCPYSNSVLYAVASGGKAGASGIPNAGIVLATVLGNCSSLASGATFTIDEATTVAMAYAASPFLAGRNLGAAASNSNGLSLAAATAVNLVNATTGASPGLYFPVTGTAPIAKLDALANLLNACVVSTGPTSTACIQMYAATANAGITPTNTLDAIASVAKHPGVNVGTLYSLSTASSAYASSLSATPPDWTLTVSYAGGGMNGPTALAIDSTGKVWVANYNQVASLFTNTGAPVFPTGVTGNNLYDSYGGAVDVNDQMWITNELSGSSLNGGAGSVTVLNTAGVSPGTYSTGGINFPFALAFDPSGVAWVVDYGKSHVTLLNSTGAPLSGATGYLSSEFSFPVAVATDSLCNGYLANQSSNTITRVIADGSSFTSYVVGSGPSGLAVDAADNVWTANYYGNSVGLVSAQGVVLSGSGFTSSSILHPQGIAVDGAGNVWVTNYLGKSLSELASTASSTPGQVLSPSAGWGPDAGLAQSYAVAIDASGNLWVSNYATSTLTEFVGLAAPVKTPLLGPVRTP